MLAPSVHPLLWLFGCVLFQGTTTSTDPSVHAVTGQSQSTTHSPEVKNHTSEPSVKSTPPTDLYLTSVGQTTTAKSSSIATTPLALTARDEKSSGSRSTAASPPQGQEPKRSESTTSSATQGTSKPVTPTPKSSGYLPVPTPTDDKSPLTVAAFDKQKPGTSMVSESCSTGTSQKDNSITLISMKNINMNNSMSYPPSEKVL
ncbi:endothelial cell-specific chemotaxis regulator isoform 3-T4 [Sarcoramphus papa]|uniref:endothelial cell-specific chemotaxis regulator isoform X2 n=1 Tax=Gymnogyps californianus TaxID=33616 RepID=UPI0021C8938F|nr:endothelial cell-specific chemotaxis regulator isoform X2 [Gymnogyps californianus]